MAPCPRAGWGAMAGVGDYAGQLRVEALMDERDPNYCHSHGPSCPDPLPPTPPPPAPPADEK